MASDKQDSQQAPKRETGKTPRRPWHAPSFSVLKVTATSQYGGGGGDHWHCWDRWKCS